MWSANLGLRLYKPRLVLQPPDLTHYQKWQKKGGRHCNFFRTNALQKPSINDVTAVPVANPHNNA